MSMTLITGSGAKKQPPPNLMPAPKGNDFAAKDDRERIAFPVNVRGTKDERKAWRKAAAGQKWNEWARAALNAAAVHETT